ncbi:MAG: ferredoxin [Trebonia sp.]|jgi:ferredoxin
MRIVVDKDVCTGQAMCESIAPDLFLVDGGSQVDIQVGVVPDSRLGQAKLAVSCCPNGALELEP